MFPAALDQGGIIAGAIIGSIAVIAIAVPIAIVLSNKAKKAAEDANSPVESSLCCCGRSWATSVSVVALSCVLFVLVICFTQTFIAKYVSAAALLVSVSDGAGSSEFSTMKLLYYDLPLILTIVAAILSLGTIVSYRFLGKGIGCGIGILAIICALGAAGFCAFIGIYYMLATGGAANTIRGGIYMSYILIAFLIWATAIALIACIGMHIGKCCCCCARPDEAAIVGTQAHAVEIGAIEVANPSALK
jgi:MFS family permease